MYCAAERSWRVGSVTTSWRYSENDRTRRLRVKSSRTLSPRPLRRAFTGAASMSAIAFDRTTPRTGCSLRRDEDRDRLLLRATAVLVTDGELERAVDRVVAALRGGELHGQRELRLLEHVGVALVLARAAGLELGLRERDAVGRGQRELDRELGVDVEARAGCHGDLRRRLGTGLRIGRSVDRDLAFLGPELQRVRAAGRDLGSRGALAHAGRLDVAAAGDLDHLVTAAGLRIGPSAGVLGSA